MHKLNLKKNLTMINCTKKNMSILQKNIFLIFLEDFKILFNNKVKIN